jgi:cytochrome c oxidase assembly protein subunit 15
MRRIRSFTVTPEQYRLVAYAALIVCTLIVFTGAAVRVTGSGLGCPDWPRCDGTSLHARALQPRADRVRQPRADRRRRDPVHPRRAARLAAAAVPARHRAGSRCCSRSASAGQAVLGGLTVIYGLEPSWVIGHFLLSMLLLIACVALVWKARYEPETKPPAADKLTRWAIRGLVAFGGIVLFAGTIATAAGPHAGGSGTGDIVPRLDFRGSETFDWAIHQHGALATCSASRRRHLVPRPLAPALEAHPGLAHRGLRAAGLPGARRRDPVRDGGPGLDGLDPRRARGADVARAALVGAVGRHRRGR